MNQDLLNYLISLMPDALIKCDNCPAQIKASEAIKREGKHFHSESCADIATARLVKPQEKGATFQNWDI